MTPDIPIGDIVKGSHVLGKSSKAINANLSRATGGNDLCIVNDKNSLPKELKKKTLYVYLDSNDSLNIASHKQRDIIVDSKDLPEGTVSRLKESINDLDQEPSLEDTKALFKYAKNNKILDKTLREKTLRGVKEVAAVGLTAAEGITSLVAGREHAPKGLRDTKVRKVVKKGKKSLSKALDKSATGRNLKNKAITADKFHSKATTEVAAVVATPLSATSGAIAGRANATPIPDSYFKKKIVQPTIDTADKVWDKAKENAPKTTKAIENALDIKNQALQSEFVAQGISVAGATVAALGVTSGAVLTAPISIPIIATASTVGIGMGVNAESKKQKLGEEKKYLENIAVNSYKKQNSLKEIKEKFPDAAQTLGISEDPLRMLERETSKTYGINHSYAENSVAVTTMMNAPAVFTKAATASASPITLGLHAAGFATGMVTQVSGKFSETDAKNEVRSEIETLKKIVPQSLNSEDSYILARNAKKSRIEAEALSSVVENIQKNPSITEEEMKTIFLKSQIEEEKKISQDKNSIYRDEKTTAPEGRLNNLSHQMKEQAGYTTKFLFGKKESYKQHTVVSSEVQDVIDQSKPSPIKEEPKAYLRKVEYVEARVTEKEEVNHTTKNSISVSAEEVSNTPAVIAIPKSKAPNEKLIRDSLVKHQETSGASKNTDNSGLPNKKERSSSQVISQ